MAAIVAVSVALTGVEAANAVKTSETGNHSSVATAQEWRPFEATAYVALCDTGCTGVTATGLDVRQHITVDGRRRSSGHSARHSADNPPG